MAVFTDYLPNNFQIHNSEYLTKIPLGVPISFFINSDTVLDYVDFDDLIISSLDFNGDVISENITPVLKVDLGGGDYRIYIDNFILYNETANSTYYLLIYNSVTDEAVYVSNCFEVISLADAYKYARVKYRNSTNIFNFNYEDIPTFYNVFFVDLNLINLESEYKIDSYFEGTTGYLNSYKSQKKVSVKLEGYRFDQNACDTMMNLSLHDDIEINFRPYQVKEGWKVEYNRRTNRQIGTIELYDQTANEINLNG